MAGISIFQVLAIAPLAGQVAGGALMLMLPPNQILLLSVLADAHP